MQWNLFFRSNWQYILFIDDSAVNTAIQVAQYYIVYRFITYFTTIQSQCAWMRLLSPAAAISLFLTLLNCSRNAINRPMQIFNHPTLHNADIQSVFTSPGRKMRPHNQNFCKRRSLKGNLSRNKSKLEKEDTFSKLNSSSYSFNISESYELLKVTSSYF